MDGVIDIYLRGMYSNIPSVLGASVQATHIEMGCFDTTQTGISIPASYLDVFDGLSIADCKYDMGFSQAGAYQTATILSGDFGYYEASPPSGAAVFDLTSTAVTLGGSVQYNSSQQTLFETPANFAGSLSVFDYNTHTVQNLDSYNSVTITAGSGVDPTHGGSAVCAPLFVCSDKFGTVLLTFGVTPADSDLFEVQWTGPKTGLAQAIVGGAYGAATYLGQPCPLYDGTTPTTTSFIVAGAASTCGTLATQTALVSYWILN
jgi:hypothetical protein